MEAISTLICKARLSIADIDRQYYQSHRLTLAQQSTDCIRKNMMRVVAYIYNASESLTIRKQQWNVDQPELIDLTSSNEINLWVDLGEPNIKRVKKACRLSKTVIIYTYKKQHIESWWDNNKNKLNHFRNLEVYSITAKELEKLNHKRMTLHCTLEDGDLQISDGFRSFNIERERLM